MNRGLLIAALLLASCQHRDNEIRTSTPQPAVESRPAPSERAPAPSEGITGFVVETIDASSYTYARIDQGGRKIWVAGPQAKLAVGTKVERLEGTLMTDFHSTTLNRTFDQVYFVSGFGAGAVPKQPPVTEPPAAPSGDEQISGTVVATMEAAEYTYAQLDRGGTKVWVAGPTTKLAVGTKVGRMTGTLMTAFHSKALDRTFDQIYFVANYTVDR